jgi:hypothetical protein
MWARIRRWVAGGGSLAVGALVLAGVAHACSSGPEDTTGSTTSTAPIEDVRVTASDFANLRTMTKVRGFFVDNLLGHVDEAVAVAESPDGGAYPVGTIIQLVPQEAMVKRHKGFDPATRDWEFFFLETTANGTRIVSRGTDDVVNRFGGNCASCHSAAQPRFDMVCEQTHGCDPLPIDRPVIEAIQAGDPRPT